MKRPPDKRGRSIFAAQMSSYVLIIVAITVTFSLLFFSTAKSHLEQEVGRKLQDIARIAARNAPFERLDLIRVGDDSTRMVLRLKEKLGQIREATGVENILVLRADRSSLLDLQPDRPIGTIYTLPRLDDALLARLRGGLSVSTESYRTRSGRLLVSAYAPVMDAQDRLFAVVGVDAGSREVEVIERMRARLYAVAGLGVAVAFMLALALARTWTRPISGMAETAQRIGQGDYEARVPLPSTAELRVLADAINSMARQVERRDAKLKELSASVAHEIRNPLNSIKLLISLLEEELEEQQQRVAQPKALATLHHEIAKLNRFLTEFLTYSRPVTLVRDEVAPADLARAAADVARAEGAERGVDIIVRAEAPLPCLLVDRDRLEQSLLNVVLNAVQACPAGGRVELRVGPCAGGQDVEFVVEDTGPGIPQEIMDRLFEPFFTTKDTGTGLGLSNAEKIVKSHGGTLCAENRPPGGARFVIRLPAGGRGSKET
ncbi:MAG: ATP-binding protein [bacterium]